jgi:glucosamine-6-phosphate deaminase
MIKELKQDKLVCKIYKTREEMGIAAAEEIHNKISELLSCKEEINMIFAAAPSQNEVLAALVSKTDIEWNRINAFHMDEYIGLSDDAPQKFGTFLKNAIFDKVPFKSVNLINSSVSADEECRRYSELLKNNPVDIVCLGIGENGHIAFNDPDVADFNDKALVKVVGLDDICRQQQVNDGCFAHIDDVPETALSLTIPALTAGTYMFCVVPAATKANAVNNTMNGPVSEKCPASILRTHENAILYCDSDSGVHLL